MGERRTARVAALVAASLAVAGCTTTHELGRYAEPQTRDALEQAGRSAPLQLLVPLEPVPNKWQERHPVTSIAPEGVRWQVRPDEEKLLPAAQVRSLSTFHSGRGALEGALVGLPVFLVSSVVIALALMRGDRCVDGCDHYSYDAGVGLAAGGLIGLAAAAIGAGFGAYNGHEHRYVIAR
jgi:hypothetical protein